MNAKSFPTWKLITFALLSACDFALTYMLLTQNQDTVYESNPVAERTLAHGGWSALALFKTVIVVGVSIIAVIVYHLRPRAAHDLLAAACGAVLVAVLSGTSIAVSLPAKVPTHDVYTHAHFNRGTPDRPSFPFRNSTSSPINRMEAATSSDILE